MPSVSERPEAPTAIQTHLAASFVSLELSRSIWLITSLSPACGEKMSKHSVRAGDVAALLARFSELKRKASERTGKSFPIVVIQEAGLDGFWLHRVLQSEGVESHVVDPSSITTITSICADFLVERRGFEPLTSAVQASARLTGSRLPFLRGSSATSATARAYLSRKPVPAPAECDRSAPRSAMAAWRRYR